MCARRRGGSTRRAACSAPTTAGPSTAPAPAPGSRRPRPRGPRPGRCARPGPAPPSSPPSSPRGCSSSGLTRMAGTRPRLPNLQCMCVNSADMLRLSSLEYSVDRKHHHFVLLGFRLPKEFDDPAFSTVTIQRDLFYGYDTLMENVSDPSHIEFAHHKVNAAFRFQNI